MLEFGAYTLSLPANSVCSLGDSGYGVALFDDDCAPERDAVTIRATVSTDDQGRQRIDLQPRMRFNPDKTVVLSTYVGHALPSIDSWRIFFCPGGGFDGCVDESLVDESLTTQFDVERGLIFRRIKHFSGYLAAES